jgi:hypothetical protein
MATITLKDGDFGSNVTVIVGDAALYLPDKARPGLNELVPPSAIAEIEALSDDRTGQLRQAARLGARGFASFGPFGLAASVFAVGKVKDVEFAVRLKDGRRFTATTDAATYANLCAASRTVPPPAVEDAEAAARADAVLAKYIGRDPLPLEPEPPAADGPKPPAEALSPDPPPARAVFGRRGAR